MAESFLRDEDLVSKSEMDMSMFTTDQNYTPDFGLESRNTMGRRIDVDRIIIKPTATDKPYFNKDLGRIANDLFGVEKTVIEKTGFVTFLRREKNLAIIERDNQLRRLALKRQQEAEEVTSESI